MSPVAAPGAVARDRRALPPGRGAARGPGAGRHRPPQVDGASVTSRGRLFGKNVLEAVFRASPDEDLFLGELLVGVDEATGRRYLFRVVDVTYGSEHREPGWAERVAGTLLSDDSRGEAGLHPLHDQALRTYRVATCRCLGYLSPEGEVRQPKALPTQFSRVISPEPADCAFLRTKRGHRPIAHHH